MRDFLSGPKEKDHTHYFDTLWSMPRSKHAGGLRGHRDRILSSDSKTKSVLGFSGHQGYFELQQFFTDVSHMVAVLDMYILQTYSKSDLSLGKKLSIRAPKGQVK